MTAITRRDALLSAGAAVAVAGVPGVTLANADPEIEALLGQLRAADAHIDDIHAARRVAWERIPQNIKEAIDAYPYPSLAPQDVRDAYDRHYEATGTSGLDARSDDAYDRVNDIRAQIIQTPATTLRGTLRKVRVAWHVTATSEDLDETEPDFDGRHGRLDDPVFIWSILQDLERLAGEARS